MNTVHSITTPTLASTERAFVHWRAHRQGRGHTPQPLRRQAVALLEHHCAFHICRTLGLHADALKRWARECSDDTPSHSATGAGIGEDFVALPGADPASRQATISDTGGHTVVVERADGLRLTITGTLSMGELITLLVDAGAEPR